MKLVPRTRAAFTLIELVISSAMMVLIVSAAYLCFSSAISSRKLIETRGDATQSARVALAMISADLRAACPLSKKLEFLGMDRELEDGTEADNLDFATHNYSPRGPREGDFCEVSYFVSKDPTNGVASLWRRRDPTLDDEPLSGGVREELVPGIAGLRFEYYDGWDWFDDWGDPTGKRSQDNSSRYQPNLSGMPEAVRITIRLAAKSRSDDKTEPGMTFQTVTRLNLARRSTAAATSDTSASTPAKTEDGQQ